MESQNENSGSRGSHGWSGVRCGASRRICRILLGLGLLWAVPSVEAQQITLSEYDIPTPDSHPLYITKGPDGAVWFTEADGNKVGRISTTGVITEYAIPTPNSTPYGITSGPDGALWFVENEGNRIGRITTAGVITEFPQLRQIDLGLGLISGVALIDITAGPDGALWFTELSGSIGTITTSGAVKEYPVPNSPECGRIAAGPDGALWFTDGEGAGNVYRITASGTTTEYPGLLDAKGITLGPDGALWVAGANGGIARIAPPGSTTAYPVSGSIGPFNITSGPDGALWFTDVNLSPYIWRISTSGSVSQFPLLSSARPSAIAGGPDNAVWFADEGNNAIWKATLAPSITPGGIVPVDGATSTIEPGEWVSIYGTSLASSTATWVGNFPTTLGGASVTIDGKPAYLSFASLGQINVQAPNDSATGSVAVVVTTSGGTASATVTLAPFAPSFLLLDSKHVAGIVPRQDGSGAYGTGTYDILGPTGSSLGYATVAAKAGDTVELFAIGLGPTVPAVLAGQAFLGTAPTTNPVNVLMSNTSVTPGFAGLTGAGLYQINLTIPAGLGAGDVPLAAVVSGIRTQPGVVISVR